MHCSSCGFDNPDHARFCGACGTEIATSCASCGALNAVGYRFCASCGATLGSVAEAPLPGGAERKLVTALFVDLVGFTARAELLDPEDVRALLDRYHGLVRQELERFGGTVEKFIGDAVVALFGAPRAHEDDPERAVRAALAVRDAIAELNEAEPDLGLHVRIGVNTGEALVALDARPAAGEGMAAGDVLNAAARLQTAAPEDGVLVGEATYRATQASIEYREAPPVLAKGKREPLLAWLAVAPRARHGIDVVQAGSGPLLGREPELAVLRQALARAHAESTPRLVTLIGVPGIGKSRLVWELFSEVDPPRHPVAWRQGRSLPYGDGVTYWALGEMVKAQAGILERDHADAAEGKLARAVGGLFPDDAEARWVESHLRPLVGLGAETDLAGDRRAEAFAAWRRFFEAIAERLPLILVFEDLHWADAGLLAFVDHLVEWASGVPLLVVATARPELLERERSWGADKPNATTLSLAPLADGDVERLLDALLPQDLDADVLAALVAHAGGNPLYAEEFVRMLADDRTGAAGELALPESVHGIIAARLDALPLEEKGLVQDAAVLGKVIPFDALAALTDLPAGSVDAHLHALERKEFLRRERRPGAAALYAFRHVLVRDVAYAQMPRARRAEKHRLVAEWFEQVGADRSEDQAELLAHHYLSALEYGRASGAALDGLGERAAAALRDAGDRAAALNAFAAAARFYEAAHELVPDAHVLFRLGRARFLGEDAGEELLAEARDALLADGDLEAAAEADVHLGVSAWTRGRRDEAFTCFDAALDLLADAPPSRAKAFALATLARFHMIADDSEAAIRVGREALAMAELLGLEETLASALNSIGVARAMRGDLGGVADLEASIAVAERTGSAELPRLLLNLGSTLASYGDLERAFAVYGDGLAAAERFGIVAAARWLRAERAGELYWRGQWDEALAEAEALIEEAAGVSFVASQAVQVRGWIRHARGDEPGALADAERVLELARAARDPQFLLPALGLAAVVHASAGQTDAAAAYADELLAAWAGQSPAPPSAWIADLAAALVELGRAEELALAAAGSLRTRWLDAAEAYAAGDFAASAALYDEIGSLPDAALARLGAASRLGGGRESADLLEPALAFWNSVGATAYLHKAELASRA